MVDRPNVSNNFFDPVTWKELYQYVLAQPMTYGSKSASRVDPHGHWKWSPVYDEQKNLADIAHLLPQQLSRTWEMVRSRLYGAEPRALLRCYVNGYTYGTDGYFHYDSQRSDEDTVIIYMVDDWNPDWAGETVFLDYNRTLSSAMMDGQLLSVLPRPNRVVVAPSNMMHAARSVSRLCPKVRRTLMFKNRKQRPLSWENMSRWLVDHGALKFEHQRGSLHDHLMRVYDLMEARPCPAAACAAGAFHSVYGTNAFKHRLVQPTPLERNLLAGIIGRDAEALVYAFSQLDRPRTLNEHGTDTVDALDTMTTQALPVTQLQKEHLCLIEAANLLDQKQLDKWPVLKAIWEAK